MRRQPVSFCLCLPHADNLGAYTASRPETAVSSHLFTTVDFRFASSETYA